MLAIALALAGSVALGATDFLGGLKSRQLGALVVLVVSQVAGLLLLGLAVVIFGLSPLSWQLVLYAALSGAAVVIGVSAFWVGLTVGAMGVVAPITATSGLVPVVVGLTSGESLSAVQVVGIVFVTVGVVLASYEPGPVAAARERIAAGVGLALLAALGFGFFLVALDAATEHGSELSASFIVRVTSAGVFVLAALVAIIIGRRPRLPRRQALPVASIGALEISGIFLFAAASTRGLLAVVGAVSALFPITTILLARVVLNERLRLAQRVGSVAALAGVAMITAGAAPA